MPIRSAVELQGAMLGRHEEKLSAARLAVESLVAQVTDLTNRLHLLHPSQPSSPESRECSLSPEVITHFCYLGEPTECRTFLTHCKVVFSIQPSTYAKDRSKITYKCRSGAITAFPAEG